jgi:hypothetical protein
MDSMYRKEVRDPLRGICFSEIEIAFGMNLQEENRNVW